MKRFIYCLCLLHVVSSCSSFKEVNSYASISEKNINSFKSIDYTFNENCKFKCTRRALVSEKFQIAIKNCRCPEAKLADKNFNRLLTVLKNYFKGITALSNSKLTEYEFNAIEKPLIEGKYIKKKDLKPYNGLANLLTTMLTDNYRSKKLKHVIETANSDVALLLEKTVAIIEHNLIPTLSTRQSELQQIYFNLYNSPVTSSYEKYAIQKSYFLELEDIGVKKKALKKYCNSLIKISEGHQSLYINKDKLKEPEVKKIIRKFANELNSMVVQFKK